MQKTREELRIVANLAADSTIKQINDKSQVIVVPAIINTFYTNKQGERIEQAKTYSVELWYPAKKNLEKVAGILRKGATVCFIGQPKFSAYLNSDGEASTRPIIIADTFDVFKMAKSENKDIPVDPLEMPDLDLVSEGYPENFDEDLPF